jgi:hypothetical protein
MDLGATSLISLVGKISTSLPGPRMFVHMPVTLYTHGIGLKDVYSDDCEFAESRPTERLIRNWVDFCRFDPFEASVDCCAQVTA